LRRIIYEGLKIAQALFIDAIFAIICRALAGIFINRITAWTTVHSSPPNQVRCGRRPSRVEPASRLHTVHKTA
jgi:hypothetical protein